MVATISYSMYFLGFEFFTYSTRKIISYNRSKWGFALKNQISLHIALYIIFIPLITIMIVLGVIPQIILGWFIILLILEHISQELVRVLIAVSDQLAASWVLFLRQGLWSCMAAILVIFFPEFRSLEFVFSFWALGAALSVMLGVHKLFRLNISIWKNQISWNWISKGLKTSSLFLVSTLIIRGMFTFDRFIMESLTNLQELGAYVFYMNMSVGLVSILDAGVFVFSYPLLIKAHNSKDSKKFSKEIFKLIWQCSAISAIYFFTVYVSIDIMLSEIENVVYSEYKVILPIVMLSTFLFCAGMIPQYGLYAQGKDKHIFIGHFFGLVLFVLSTFMLSTYDPRIAVPTGLAIGFACSFLWKAISYAIVSPPNYHSQLFKTSGSI